MSIWDEVEQEQLTSSVWQQAEQDVKDGGLEEFTKGLASSTIGVAKEVVIQGLADVIKAPGEYLAFVLPEYERAAPEAQRKKLIQPLMTAKRRMEISQAQLKQTHKGVSAWAGRALGEAIPYMATAFAGGLAAGPIGAALVGFEVEGGNAYDAAKKSGATEAQAQLERGIVGSINAAIEAIQIGRLMKFQEAGKHSIRSLIGLAKRKAYGKMAKEGIKFTGRLLKTSLEEGLEEFLQEGVSFAIPANLRNQMPRKPDGSPDIWAIAQRLGAAALGGAFAGGLLGGAGAVSIDVDIQRKVADVTRNLTPAQRNEVISGIMDQAIEDDPDMSPEEKLSARFILGNIRYNIEQELVSRLNTNDVEIVDSKTLAQVGEDIRKALGITEEVDVWKFSKRKVKRQMGQHVKLAATGKHEIKVNGGHWAFFGEDRQAEIRRTIIHELGHIAAPPVTIPMLKEFPKSAKIIFNKEGFYSVNYKGTKYNIRQAKTEQEARKLFVELYGQRRSVHHKEFKKWYNDNVGILSDEIKRTLGPVMEAHLTQEAPTLAELGQLRIVLPDGQIAVPQGRYVDAKDRPEGSGYNPWVKTTDEPFNDDRMLLIQFASDILTTDEDPKAKAYYDKLHDVRKGYTIPGDFWELPQWIGEVSNSIPNTDLYVVRDMEEAAEFLSKTDYGSIAFSALDINKDKIKTLATKFRGDVHVGGYVNPGYFKDTDNIIFYKSVEELAKRKGIKYRPGVNYKLFEGSETQPRLCLSKGCLYKCTMCLIHKLDKGVKEIPSTIIDKQIKAFKGLNAQLVYLDDKTFGQAKNHKKLPELYTKIKKAHPEFKGFIIQTTATDFLKLDDQFIRDAGIRYVEIGVESFNDSILKKLHKPAREKSIQEAVVKARSAGVDLIANIIIGIPGETAQTYQNTLNWIRNNSDVISHLNPYNLALYEQTELAKELGLVDINENKVEKAYHKDPQLHRNFANQVFQLGSELLDKPSKTDQMPETAIEKQEKPKAVKAKRRSKRVLLALGHKIPKQIGMSDNQRRDWIEAITGKRSLKELTKPELQAIVELMEEEFGTAELQPEDFEKPIQIGYTATTMSKVMNSAAADVDALPAKVEVPKKVTKRFVRKRGRGVAKTIKSILWGEENDTLSHLADKLGPTFSDVIGNNIALHSYKIQSGHSRAVFDYFRQEMAANKISDADLAKMSKSQNPRFRLVQAIQEMRGTGTEIHTIEINGKQYDMTMGELIELYLIARQEDGIRHLTDGGAVINTVETDGLDEGTITMINMLVENDPQAMAVINTMTDIGENIWKPSINNVSQRMEGKDIAVIPNWWGLEVYYPRRLGGKQEKFNINLIENRSIFKDRTKSNRPVVIRDAFQRFSVFESGISEYVGYAESTRIARTLINNPDISTALDQKGYGDTRRRIMTILDRAQSLPREQGAFGKFMAERLPGLYRAYLYFNPRVVVSQATSSMNYGAYVSPKYMVDIRKGLTPKSIERTLEMSSIAYDRFYMGHSSLALGEMARSDAVLRMFSHKSSDANKLGITLRIADMAALAGGLEIAIHEYQDAKDGKIDGDSAIYWADKNVTFEEGSADWQREVVDRAEWLWQRSQPSWDKWNRSMMTSGLVRQIFFPFRTFHEKSMNILKEANLEYDRSNKTPNDKVRKAKKWGAVLSSYALNTIIRAALFALAGRELKKPWQYVSDLLEAPMSMFPILGTVLKNSIGNFINVLIDEKLKFQGEAIEAFPATVINMIAQSPADFSVAAGYMINGETDKAKVAFKRAVKKLYEGIGTAEGIPTSEIKRVYKGWIEPEEEGEPTGPGRRARRVRPRRVRARR